MNSVTMNIVDGGAKVVSVFLSGSDVTTPGIVLIAVTRTHVSFERKRLID